MSTPDNIANQKPPVDSTLEHPLSLWQVSDLLETSFKRIEEALAKGEIKHERIFRNGVDASEGMIIWVERDSALAWGKANPSQATILKNILS
jgi:hypothetical protein